jgi:hypothetical protein
MISAEFFSKNKEFFVIYIYIYIFLSFQKMERIRQKLNKITYPMGM